MLITLLCSRQVHHICANDLEWSLDRDWIEWWMSRCGSTSHKRALRTIFYKIRCIRVHSLLPPHTRYYFESLTEEMARKGTSTSLSHHFLSQMLGDSSSILATLFWIQIILDSILIDCPELQWYELTCDCSEKHRLSCTYRFHLESRLFAVL